MHVRIALLDPGLRWIVLIGQFGLSSSFGKGVHHLCLQSHVICQSVSEVGDGSPTEDEAAVCDL